jgi:hypothetical protein
VTPNQLIQTYHDAAQSARQAAILEHKARQAIEEYMQDEQAVALPAQAADRVTGEVTEYMLTYKATPEYDRVALEAAKEFLHLQEWLALLTNPEPPKRVVDIRRFKELAKQGGEFKRILDAATRPGTPTLKITEVKS